MRLIETRADGEEKRELPPPFRNPFVHELRFTAAQKLQVGAARAGVCGSACVDDRAVAVLSSLACCSGSGVSFLCYMLRSAEQPIRIEDPPSGALQHTRASQRPLSEPADALQTCATSICLSVYLSIYLSIYLSVCLSVWLSLVLFVWCSTNNHLFRVKISPCVYMEASRNKLR